MVPKIVIGGSAGGVDVMETDGHRGGSEDAVHALDEPVLERAVPVFGNQVSNGHHRVVAGEGAAWTLIGSGAGLALGLAVAVVLVHVVNPQSFHWTMDLLVPWGRLLAVCAAVVIAGTLTAWLAGRAAASRDAVMAVKEDW